jgi:hypothetical protein
MKHYFCILNEEKGRRTNEKAKDAVETELGFAPDHDFCCRNNGRDDEGWLWEQRRIGAGGSR